MFKSSAVYLISSVIAKLSPFILMPILTSELSAKDFSLGSVYISAIGFISILISLGTQSIIPKFYFEAEKTDFSRICTKILVLIIFSFIFCILSLSVYSLLIKMNWYYYLILFSSLGMVLCNLYLSLLRTQSLLVSYVKFEITFTLVSFISVFSFIYTIEELSFIHWVLPICIVNVAYGVFSLILFIRRVEWNLDFETSMFQSIINICFPLIPHALALIIINLSDRIILVKFLEPEIAANYIVAANIAVVMKVISDAFMKAWNPFYFKNADKKALVIKYKLFFIFFYMASSIAFVFIINFTFHYFFSSEYELALSILPYLILSYFIFVFYQLNVSVLIKENSTSILKFISPASALVNVIGNVFLIPIYGVFVAAYMTCASYFLMATATSYITYRLSNEKVES